MIYIYCTNDTASNAVLQYCATRPFGAQAHDATVSRHCFGTRAKTVVFKAKTLQP